VSAGLAAVCLAACVEDTAVTPTAHALLVHAVLDAGARDQWVIVQATDGSFAGQIAVAGATVIMTLPNGATVVAAEERDGNVAEGMQQQPVVSPVYHFALDRLGIALVPGRTYQLRVVVPDGRAVTGRTTIPNAIPVSVGRDTTAFDWRHDTLTADLARVPGAARYETNIAFASGGSLSSVFSDTAVSIPGTLSVFSLVANSGAGASARVVISAVDSAYYAYYRRSADPLTGIGTDGNLTGALGVFGAVVAVKRFALIVH
jgi:Domain of unknown function (DUF4249)